MFELEEGTVLYTKDGRKVGNAKIIDIYSDLNYETFYVIRTDFGNHASLRLYELKDLFYFEK